MHLFILWFQITLFVTLCKQSKQVYYRYIKQYLYVILLCCHKAKSNVITTEALNHPAFDKLSLLRGERIQCAYRREPAVKYKFSMYGALTALYFYRGYDNIISVGNYFLFIIQFTMILIKLTIIEQ